MALFKKEKAVVIDKMNVLKDITLSEENCKFDLHWSTIKLEAKEVPGLISDLIQIYGLLKPALDRASEKAENEKTQEQQKLPDNELIDLSEIPF